MLFGMNPCTLVPCAMCMAQLNPGYDGLQSTDMDI